MNMIYNTTSLQGLYVLSNFVLQMGTLILEFSLPLLALAIIYFITRGKVKNKVLRWFLKEAYVDYNVLTPEDEFVVGTRHSNLGPGQLFPDPTTKIDEKPYVYQNAVACADELGISTSRVRRGIRNQTLVTSADGICKWHLVELSTEQTYEHAADWFRRS